MQQPELEFINSLRQSSRYIEQHRGKTFVIYVPGETLQRDDTRKQLTEDIGLLHNMGIKIVLVMGAGPQLEAALEANQLTWQMHLQIRVTTPEILPVFQQTIALVRNQLEANFSKATCTQSKPITITSGNWIIAQPKGVVEGVDFQHTGKLRKVNHRAISDNLNAGQICLLTPIAYSLTGELFNLNTFEQACEVASAIQADKLMVFTSEEETVGLPKQLSIPKLKVALENSQSIEQKRFLAQILSTSGHVKRIHLMDKHETSAILVELFTRDGSGTLIFSDRYHQVRQAKIEDVGGIIDLISPLEEQAVLVKRSRERLELEIENFIILERDQHIIGCAALYPHDGGFGELACLAVHADYQGQELGHELLDAIETTAVHTHINKLFLLTTHTHHWFIEHGFHVSQLNELPEAKQAMYNFQRNSKVLIKAI
ncbi:MAG: amino-acid N-acetyltransferase [Thiotrichales bacterium]|nr:amino-acid N-acetyltransferase [Thiotrichales bacterium]